MWDKETLRPGGFHKVPWYIACFVIIGFFFYKCYRFVVRG
jgi:hypothetical protein